MITDQAFILHKRAYKDSSELIKVLCKNNGLIDLISKGSRNPKSKVKGQLQPFIESQISYTGRTDLKTLVGAEQSDILQRYAYLNHVSMLYCNELIMLLKFNDGIQNGLYNNYVKAIEALKQTNKVSLILRQFEWHLCCTQGYQLSIPTNALSSDLIAFCPINGLEVNHQKNHCSVQTFETFIHNQPMNSNQVKEMGRLMRSVVDHMVHGKTIQSRSLLINLNSSKL